MVSRQQRREAGKIGIAGIGGERQNKKGRDLENGIHQQERTGEDALGYLPDHCGITGRIGQRPIAKSQDCRSHKESANDDGHPGQSNGGIASFWFLEGWYSIGNGFCPRESRTASRERAQDEEEGEGFSGGSMGKVAEEGMVFKEENLERADND